MPEKTLDNDSIPAEEPYWFFCGIRILIESDAKIRILERSWREEEGFPKLQEKAL
jgi:hypothetical protein